MLSRKRAYWIIQILGWSGVIIVNIITASFSKTLSREVYFSGFFLMICGILVTHVFREISKQLKWNNMGIFQLVPRVFLGALVMSLVYTLLYGSLSDLFIPRAKKVLVFTDMTFVNTVLNFSLLFFFWSILYYAFHIFENYKRQEINNLQLQASMTEIELSSIKAQMNPHFMFNAMNSIRALIDENPDKAKEAVTGLSSILRSILMASKKQLVPFKEEVALIKRYLGLEKIRFEERLLVNFEIDKDTLDYPVPPLMVQTIVENGIKHGISKRKEGGLITVKAFLDGEKLCIEIINTGQISDEKSSTGIGIANTTKRLKTLYEGKGQFNLQASGEYVKASIIIPYRKKYESINN